MHVTGTTVTQKRVRVAGGLQHSMHLTQCGAASPERKRLHSHRKTSQNTHSPWSKPHQSISVSFLAATAATKLYFRYSLVPVTIVANLG